MTSFAQADDFELFTRIRGQFALTRLSTGVYDCPADFSEMTLCVSSREAFKPPQCNGHSLTAKEASRMLGIVDRAFTFCRGRGELGGRSLLHRHFGRFALVAVAAGGVGTPWSDD